MVETTTSPTYLHWDAETPVAMVAREEAHTVAEVIKNAPTTDTTVTTTDRATGLGVVLVEDMLEDTISLTTEEAHAARTMLLMEDRRRMVAVEARHPTILVNLLIPIMDNAILTEEPPPGEEGEDIIDIWIYHVHSGYL